jgi:hypothetical protein
MNGIEGLWLIIILILSFGLTWFQYQNQFKKNKYRSLWYAIPRLLAYICLGILIFNPKIKQVTYLNEKPDLIIGLDNSMSIKQLTDTENYKKEIENFLSDEDLKEKFNIHSYSFGEGYKSFDSLNFSEPQTNISNFISQISKVFTNRNSHILLFTDGQQTLGSDYSYTARNFQNKIVPIIVGDTTNYVDTKIDRINTNPYAFLNNQFPVEVFVSSNAQATVKTDFIIKQNSKVISRKSINFDEEKKAQSFTIYLKAGRIGVNAYTAELESIEEKNLQNNSQKFAVEVIDERTKILILYDKLHPDLGMLKESIESNPQREVRLQSIKEKQEKPGSFNLVILYQPNFSFKSTFEVLQNQNINHIVITGSQTDYGFLNQVQTDFMKSSSGVSEDFYAELNPGYSSYQIEDIGFDLFPPLKDTFGDIQITTEADILLYQNINGFSTQQPLLMSISGKKNQKSAYLFGENIWRWRMRSYVEEGSFKKFDGFIDQLVQFVSSTQTKKRLVTDMKSFYNKGDNNVVNVQYFDKNYNFDPNENISLNIKNQETSQKFSYNFIIKNNNYSTRINDLPPGNYNYTIEIPGKNLSVSGQFRMIDFLLEKSFYRANVEKLTGISDTLFYDNQFESLKNYLVSQQKFKPIQKSIEKKESLVNWWVLLVLIVVFLGIEWFSRKYHGLI